MTDPFGAIHNQAIGDLGVHIGNGQWAASGQMPIATVPARIAGAGSSQSTYGGNPGTSLPSKLYVAEGNATVPVVANITNTFPTLSQPLAYFSRHVKTDPANVVGDGGAVYVGVTSYDAGSGVGVQHQPQVNGVQLQLDQYAPTDALGFGSQIAMRDPRGGGAYGYYTNLQLATGQTVTISHATPGVVSWTGHTQTAGVGLIRLGTSGTLPAPLTPGTQYVVCTVINANSFTLALPATPATPINTTTNGSGTHTAYANGGLAAMNPLIANTSKVDFIYDGFGTMLMSNLMLQAIGDGSTPNLLAGAGILMGPGNSLRWDTGIAVYAGSVATTTFVDDSSSTTSIKIRGTHTTGIDLSGGTFTTQILVDATYNLSFAGANPIIQFDSSDFVSYNRSTNTYGFTAIGVAMATIAGGTPGANNTAFFVQEGATPTLRQLKTFDPGNLGVNFTAGQLVCVLQ